MQLGLMFAGQGAQHPGMGAALHEASAAARAVYDEADRILGWQVSRMCFAGTQEELTACAHCQPAIYVTSLAAYAARREAGELAEVSVVGGLSLGELSALTAAGVFTFEDGLKAVARRGELMDELCRRAKGAMAAVLGAEDAVVEEVAAKHGIDVANYNCPGQRIVSGAAELVAEAVAELSAQGVRTVALEVAGAYHSRLMWEAGEAFGEYLAGVPLGAPQVPVVQNVTGELLDGSPETIRRRLAEQIFSPVRWEACCRQMMARCARLLELGPGHVLAGLAKRIDRRFPVESADL